MPVMKRAPADVSISTALAVGFSVTLGLWLYTEYAFTQRIDNLQREAAEVTLRYTRAQELLSDVRAHVLLNSIRMRDAVLDPQPNVVQKSLEQIEHSHRTVTQALADYEPVMGSGVERSQLARLQNEVEQFHTTSIAVLAAAGRDAARLRELLNRDVVPRREAMLTISDDIQAINRRVFEQHQRDIAEIHRGAETDSRERLAFVLGIGLLVVFATGFYATRLEGRVRVQMPS